VLYREDKHSGNKLSALGLGCMRLPTKLGAVDEQATEQIVLRALELGVNYFDTAYLYSGSEEALGNVVARNDLRDRMYIASKLPHGKCRQTSDFDKYFNTTLERLQTTWLDYYLIHNVANAEQWQRVADLGIKEWIAARKQDGSIRNIGFSFHGSISEFKKMLDVNDWDFVQIQYNYMNEHYQAGSEGLALAAERGLSVIIMEPLLGGKLAVGLPESARAAMATYSADRSPAEWGLRWLWNQPQVTCVLSGMGSLEQLEDNASAAANAPAGCMGIDELAIIEVVREEFGRSYKVPCTGCNYCMPCPKGISIPACFATYNESYSIGWTTGLFHYLTSVGAGSNELHLPSDCVRCGACMAKCPQHIAIPDELVKVRKRLQPGPVGPALRLAGKIMSR